MKNFIRDKSRFKASDISERKTPNATAIIWNFKYRLGSRSSEDFVNVKEAMEIQKKIVLTKSILGVRTHKSKSSYKGSFTMELAPTKNWVSELTLGSWICIMMSPDQRITKPDTKKINPKLVKFIGVIKSVSCEVKVGPSGNRRTVYTVKGSDWAEAFDDRVYFDPAWATVVKKDYSALSLNIVLMNKSLSSNSLSQGTASFSTRNNLERIRNYWFNIDEIFPISDNEKRLIENIYPANLVVFSIPKEVLEFMDYDISHHEDNDGYHPLGSPAYLRTKQGKITANGVYKDMENHNLIKMWNFANIFGNHTVWQLYNAVNAENVEEIFNDLYFDTEEITLPNLGINIPKANELGSSLSAPLNTKFNISPSKDLENIEFNLNNPLTKSYTGEPKLRFTLFNRIMPFVIRDQEDVLRFSDIRNEQNKYKNKLIPKLGSSFGTKLDTGLGFEKGLKINTELAPDVGLITPKGGNRWLQESNRGMVEDLTSYYADVPRTFIPLNDIFSISYEVDLSEKINILEVNLGKIVGAKVGDIFKAQFRHYCQEWEGQNLFARDGLKLRKLSVDHFILPKEDMDETTKEKKNQKVSKKDEENQTDTEKKIEETKETEKKSFGDITKWNKNAEESVLEKTEQIYNDVEEASLAPDTSDNIVSTSRHVSEDVLNRWASYLPIWKEWYFDLHKMVKGYVILYGMNKYLTVGTNIVFPTRALTNSKNFNMKDKSIENSYVLAHVESVSHVFHVQGNGSRSYRTNIGFTRGIVVNSIDELGGPLSEYCFLDNILTNRPYDQTFDNDNVNVHTETKLEGSDVVNIYSAFDKEDNEEES